ncbi:MAG: hypothetical protein KDA60_04940, partial [Planctomycetales bacterium]|nr:hypothetical protein [Planctomycetales bacterium]
MIGLLGMLAMISTVGCNFEFSTGGFEPPPESASFRVEGPPGQRVNVGVRYHDSEGSTVSWHMETSSVELNEEGLYQADLEGGHDGFSIGVAVPTKETVKLILLADNEAIETQSNSASRVRLQIDRGVKMEDNELKTDAIWLKKDDRDNLLKIIDTAAIGNATDVVVAGSDSYVDAPTLNLLFKAIAKNLGAIADRSLDGWTTFKMEDGDAGFEGNLIFDKGHGKVTLGLREGKLSKFYFASEQLPPDWFSVPEDTSSYQTYSRQLIDALWNEDYDGALKLYSPSIRETV